MRASAASRSPSASVPLSTRRRRWASIRSSARSSCSWEMSSRRTSKPASAATSAMPVPIWPAPITPMRRISGIGGRLAASWSMGIDGVRGLWYCSAVLAQLGGELRDDLEQITDQTVVGDLEDRRLLVLVDRDDDLAVLHPGEVLDGAGDADCDVQVRRDDLAGLPDLVFVGHIAGVDRGARGADRRVEHVGQLLDDLEVLAAAHAAAARDHDARRGQLRPLAAAHLASDEAGDARRVDRLDPLDTGAAAFLRRGVERRGAHGENFQLVAGLHRRERVAGVDVALEGVGPEHLDDV